MSTGQARWMRHPPHFRPIVVVFVVAALLTVVSPDPAVQAMAEVTVDGRPNIILITSDDQRLSDMWMMDNVRTLIGDAGTTFDNFYAPFPLCCPARASIMTGQNAHNHRVLDNAAPLGGFAALDGSSTVATWLQDAGYRTAFAGKYLNHYGEKPVKVPPGWADWHGIVGGGDYFDTRVFENGVPRQYTGVYQTDLFGDISSDVITASAAGDAPFFLWSSFYAPHSGTPVEPDDPKPALGYNMNTPAVAPRHRDDFANLAFPQDPSYNEADVSDKPSDVRNRPPLSPLAQAAITENYQQRLEALLALDEAVAKMMSALEATGERDNTIVIFTTDNGFMLGEHRISAGKTVPYEASAQLPFLIRGPGVPVGESREQLAALIDLAPTFVDLAGTQAGLAMDGVSLLPMLANPQFGRNRKLLVEAGPDALGEPMAYSGVHTSQWLYVEYDGGDQELYDMQADPFQLQSLHADPAYDDQQAQLAAVLAVLRYCTGPTCRGAPLPPVGLSRLTPDVLGRGAAAVEVVGTGQGLQPGSTFAVEGVGVTVAPDAAITSDARVVLHVSVAATATFGLRDVIVTNPDGSTAQCTGCFRVGSVPTISSVAPASRGQGAQNQTITVTGTDFAADASVSILGTGVTILSQAVQSENTVTLALRVTTSAAVGRRTLTVTNGDGASATAEFAINPGPKPTSASPPVAAGKTQLVTVSGTNFVSGAGLKVRVASPGFTVGTPSAVTATSVQVQVRVPATAGPGSYKLVVINPDGGQGSCPGCLVVP
ncbi:MAG: sulfatase-like hydrolase/transferase [Actinomycetota bacterium]|nr:sulfatase-like hydrolase/transferase [Actinomycetota bacterium]